MTEKNNLLSFWERPERIGEGDGSVERRLLASIVKGQARALAGQNPAYRQGSAEAFAPLDFKFHPDRFGHRWRMPGGHR